jgi:hypothetical protein
MNARSSKGRRKVALAEVCLNSSPSFIHHSHDPMPNTSMCHVSPRYRNFLMTLPIATNLEPIIRIVPKPRPKRLLPIGKIHHRTGTHP